MATITNPPVQVSSNHPGYRQSNTEINSYYFEIGSNLYIVLIRSQIADLANIIGVFKRAANDYNGAWTEMDTAGSPDQGSAVECYATVTGTTLAIFYILSGNTSVKICEFDTATDTYGTPTAGLTVSNFSQNFAFGVKSNGDYVIVGNTSTHLYYAVNSAGTWGSITNLVANTSVVLCDETDSVNDVMYLFTNETGFRVSFRRLDLAAFTISGATLLTGNRSNAGGRPDSVLWGADSIAVAYILTNGNTVARIGTPLSAPVFTDYDVEVIVGHNEVRSFATMGVGLDGSLNCFWTLIDYSTTPITDQLRQSVFDGVSTWGTPTIFYDETANPPANDVPDPTNQFVHTPDMIELAQGWTGAVSLETFSAATQFCTGFFLDQTPIPPAPGCPTIYVARQPQPEAPAPPAPPGIPT